LREACAQMPGVAGRGAEGYRLAVLRIARFGKGPNGQKEESKC